MKRAGFWSVLAVLTMGGAGCGHTKKVEEPQAREQRTASPQAAPPATGFAKRVTRKGELGKLQQALADRGYLKKGGGDALDDDTQRALRRFQKDQRLPETGFPDAESVSRLGLDPDEFFRSEKKSARAAHEDAAHEDAKD